MKPRYRNLSAGLAAWVTMLIIVATVAAVSTLRPLPIKPAPVMTAATQQDDDALLAELLAAEAKKRALKEMRP